MRVVNFGRKKEPKSLDEIWLGEYSFFRNTNRKIDKETMFDLLSVVQYECHRANKAEDVGIVDNAASFEILFDYVLDALDVTHKKEEREPYYELFYGDIVDVNPSIFNAEKALKKLLELKSL